MDNKEHLSSILQNVHSVRFLVQQFLGQQIAEVEEAISKDDTAARLSKSPWLDAAQLAAERKIKTLLSPQSKPAPAPAPGKTGAVETGAKLRIEANFKAVGTQIVTALTGPGGLKETISKGHADIITAIGEIEVGGTSTAFMLPGQGGAPTPNKPSGSAARLVNAA